MMNYVNIHLYLLSAGLCFGVFSWIHQT